MHPAFWRSAHKNQHERLTYNIFTRPLSIIHGNQSTSSAARFITTESRPDWVGIDIST